MEHDGHEKELSGGFRRTTNNRMEILAVIVGLEALMEPCSSNGIQRFPLCRRRHRKGLGQKVAGQRLDAQQARARHQPRPLGKALIDALDKHDVELRWVRGHAGNVGNARADKLAVAAAKGKPICHRDEGFENPRKACCYDFPDRTAIT